MHELGIINSMVKTIEKVVKDENLTEVETIVLEVGELSGVVPRFLEECYPAAVYKTFMEKTRLELEVIPGIVRCKDCGKEFNAMAHDLACPCCGSREMEILSGNDFMIKELVCR